MPKSSATPTSALPLQTKSSHLCSFSYSMDVSFLKPARQYCLQHRSHGSYLRFVEVIWKLNLMVLKDCSEEKIMIF